MLFVVKIVYNLYAKIKYHVQHLYHKFHHFTDFNFQRNATKGKRVKVLRGISNHEELGRILEVDGKRQLDLWGTQECNTFKGTDGWIFPPLLTKETEIASYAADLCR